MNTFTEHGKNTKNLSQNKVFLSIEHAQSTKYALFCKCIFKFLPCLVNVFLYLHRFLWVFNLQKITLFCYSRAQLNLDQSPPRSVNNVSCVNLGVLVIFGSVLGREPLTWRGNPKQAPYSSQLHRASKRLEIVS